MVVNPTVQPRMSRAATFGLMAGPLMSMLDSSVVNVATADIASTTGRPVNDIQWVVSGYLLALAVGLCLTPYLTRRLGALRLYRWSLLAFTLTSAACALTSQLEPLIAFRALQGLAGAPLAPIAMSIFLGDAEHRRDVPAVVGIALFAAPALGPTLGGWLIAAGGWPWVFWINVPIGLAAVVAARVVPIGSDAPPEPARFDLAGLLLLGPGLVALLWAAERGPQVGWADLATLLPLAAGLILFGGYLVHARRRWQPLIDLRPMARPQNALALVLTALATIVSVGALFLIPLFAQQVQGHSPQAVGIVLLPAGILTGVGAAVSASVVRRFGLRPTLLVSFAALAASTAPLLLVDAGTPLWLFAVVMTGRAAAIGLVTTPLLQAISERVVAAEVADANTTFNIAQRVTASFGIAWLATVFASGSKLGDPVGGLHDAAIAMTVLAAICFVLGWAVRPAPCRLARLRPLSPNMWR